MTDARKLTMDSAQEHLKRLHEKLKTIRSKVIAVKDAHEWLPGILDDVYEAEDLLANMRIFAESWQEVAAHLNGVKVEPIDPDETPLGEDT